MRFITARELRGASPELWKKLSQQEEIVITLNGKPVALLTPISESTFEDSIKEWRRAKALMAAAQMHKQAAKTGLAAMTLDEVDAEVTAVRKGYKR